METRLRLLLVMNGLPGPEAQVELRAQDGRFVARVDLYYPEPGLALEYDGANHRDGMIDDNRRQNAIQELDVRVLRYTGPDLRDRPGAVVAEVGGAQPQMTLYCRECDGIRGWLRLHCRQCDLYPIRPTGPSPTRRPAGA